jgi:dipeptidyl aminopeptidase/acylaminoacyl peptidase
VVAPGGRALRIVDRGTLLVRDVPVHGAVDLRDPCFIATDPNHPMVIARARRTYAGSYGVIAVDLTAGTSTVVEVPSGDVSNLGYCATRAWRAIAHVTSNGASIPYWVTATGGRWRMTPVQAGVPVGTKLSVLAVTHDALQLRVGRTAEPPAFYVLRDRPAVLRSPHRPQSVPPRLPRPSVTWLGGPDGVRFPVLTWRAQRPGAGRYSPPRAVVMIHGGPESHRDSEWDAPVAAFVARGVTVVAPNYRGSTGWGDSVRVARGGLTGQAADVRATLNFMRTSLGVRPENTVVFGHSYGAMLAALVLADIPRPVRGAVLASLLPRLVGYQCAPPATRVVLVHGTVDSVAPLRGALDAYRLIRCAVGARRSNVVLLPTEGHDYDRFGSWAAAYGAVMNLF